MKKYILSLIIGIGVLCGIAYAQDFIVVHQGDIKSMFSLPDVESITHADGNVNVVQNGQSTTFPIQTVDSITFLNVADVDTEAPSIFILSPTSSEVYVTSESHITISGIANDNIAIKSVTYISSNGLTGTAVGTDEWSIPDLELALGENVIEVTASDVNDNKATATIKITRNQTLAFIGTPTVTPNVMFTNEPKDVWVTATIAPNESLIASSVKLIEVDENNNVIREICNLYDNGDLSVGDEIKGDNTFSVICTLSFPTEGTRYFRVVAKTQETEGEVEGTSAVFTINVLDWEDAQQEALTIEQIHAMIQEKLNELGDLPADELANILIEWLLTLPGVESVAYEDGILIITHSSGIVSYVILEDNGDIKGASSGASKDRRRGPAVPLSKQTRGIYNSPTPFKNFAASTIDDVILSKNVLIWAPYEDEFTVDMGPSLNTIFNNSPASLNVTYLTLGECTRASLKNLSNYGIVVIDSHGREGNLIFTREKVELVSGNDIAQITENISDIIWSYCQMVTRKDGTYYAITPKYIKERVIGVMPNSVIFNGTCESLMTDNLANAFISKGAKTYVGFKGDVSATACKVKADEFFSNLAGPYLKTTGESFMNYGMEDYQMRGSSAMHFSLGLINGDFEYGNLNGWTTDGDGRVITQLGYLLPTQGTFMGIISTGLGYTESYGQLSQTFQVTNQETLSLNWNFISEEFMEWVGSIYQDFLRISIIDGENVDVLFYMNVDAFAATYDLISVSPEIVFDQGGAYMTGWMNSTFDISQYKGKTVTLLIESGDVGDSYYDSATLLDEIRIY